MLQKSTLFRLAALVAVLFSATLAVAQPTRVANIPDNHLRNYVVVQRGYSLEDSITTEFFELNQFPLGSMYTNKPDDFKSFVNASRQDQLLILRGFTNSIKFTNMRIKVSDLMNLILGIGRTDKTADDLIDQNLFVDVIFSPGANDGLKVGLWRIPLATGWASRNDIRGLKKADEKLQSNIDTTNRRVDSLSLEVKKIKQGDEHGYFGMVISFGVDGALVSGRLNDPYGLFGAIQLKPSENFGVKVALVANRMGEGHGGMGGRLEFIINKVVVGGGYHVFSNFKYSPAWTRHWKNIPLYLGYQIPVAWMVFTPYAGVQLNMDFGDLKYDGKWAINRTDPMIGIHGEIINIKLGDVK